MSEGCPAEREAVMSLYGETGRSNEALKEVTAGGGQLLTGTGRSAALKVGGVMQACLMVMMMMVVMMMMIIVVPVSLIPAQGEV